MFTFKQFNNQLDEAIDINSESFVGALKGALMGPQGPNHNPNKTKKTREVEPDRVTLSPEAIAARNAEQRAATSSPSGPASQFAGTKRVR